jgi:hypothetical protein
MLEDQSEIITISRQQLYEEVWTTPTVTLAKRYGVSDVALAKICRKHKIPKPSLGHWARVAHGKQVERQPLPAIDDPRLQQIRIRKRVGEHGEESLSPVMQAALAAEKAETNCIHVSQHLEALHPLVGRTLKSLHSARKDERGLVRPVAQPCLDIAVGPNSIERAARIMDALVKALEGRGYPVTILEKERKRLTCVKVMDETLHIQLREGTNRTERQLTPAQKKEREQSPWMYSHPKYDFVPSGCLTLYIGSDEYLGGSRVIWADGAKQRIEHCLNSFICGLLKAANAVKVVRAKRDRQEREWERQERRRLQEEERIRKEKERIRDLETEVTSWEKSLMIRQYLSVVKEAAIKKHGQIKPGSELSEWLSWGHRYADSIDPLTPSTI